MDKPNLSKIEMDSYSCGLPNHVHNVWELSQYILDLEKQIKALQANQCMCRRGKAD
jgi:hypothetical protein